MAAAGLAAGWAAVASLFVGIPAALNGQRFIEALSLGSLAMIIHCLYSHTS